MNRKHVQGFTLIEMMISIVVASLLSIAVVNTFTSQSSMFTTQSQRNRMANDGRDAYEVISRLLRQAEASSIATSISAGSTTIDFTIPAGFPVWPNTTAPYDNNAVRLQWSSSGNHANRVRIGTASSIAALSSAELATLAGDTSGSNTQIIDLELTKDASNAYSLALTARAGSNGPSSTFQGMVMPRN